ncbi:hypothetical protein PG996_006685 [Apiospora saccharicola]|uniref:Uncharacterized protein n=1 Tax=Apiospora saccharicola TaxID=335842 RepID=A0ABR1V8P5_9PEZI
MERAHHPLHRLEIDGQGSRCNVDAQGEAVPCATFWPQAMKPGPLRETSLGTDMSALITPMLETFAARLAMSQRSTQQNQMVSVPNFGRLEPSLESIHGTARLIDF